MKLSAQHIHSGVIALLRRLDNTPAAIRFAQKLHNANFTPSPVDVGGIRLSYPLILAAGLVKGDGFFSETDAICTARKRNIIPGWRIVPALVGPVEYGSFTRHSRLGNDGTVLWRLRRTRTTQNRVGLRNPGARAAADFLASHKEHLPLEYGINIAPTPGVEDTRIAMQEIWDTLDFFIEAGIKPSWFTLNLSCPNTEDGISYQLENKSTLYCKVAIDFLKMRAPNIPLWVKVSPGLTFIEYKTLVRIFHAFGVKAIVATNTYPYPKGGVGGGVLSLHTFTAIKHLQKASLELGYKGDLIACGGILDGRSWNAYRNCGIKVGQYWSALVYRGPLAAALIQKEAG